MNHSKIPAYSRQESLLQQSQALTSSDMRRGKRFRQQLSEEERNELERNAHYDGSAWQHLRQSEPSALWDSEMESGEVSTYEESLLGYFNVLCQSGRRFSPAAPHQHRFVELYYVVRGLCSDDVCGRQLTLVPGDLILLQPETLHALSIPGDCVVYQAAIRERTFRSICQDLLSSCEEPPSFCSALERERSAFLLFRTGVEPELLGLMEQMLSECAHPHKYFNVMLQGQLASLLALLLNEQEPETFSLHGEEQTTLDEAHLSAYIRSHLSEVTLQRAAAHFGFSAPYFCTLVRERTGQNFSALLQQEKLSAAERMLLETNYPIRIICEKAGYESVSQFSGTFKRKYGTSPGAYRRRASQTSF